MAPRRVILLWPLVVFPFAVVLVSWMAGLEWSDFCSDGGIHRKDGSDYGHTPHSLSSVSCPAQRGRDLEDYWECLFRTSITAQGWEEHHQIKVHLFHERLRLEHEALLEPQRKRCSNETLIPGPHHQVRRQTGGTTPLLPFNPQEVATHFTFQKMLAITADLHFLDDLTQKWVVEKAKPRVRECQLDYIWPGESIVKFIKCLQQIMAELWNDPEVQKTMTDYGFEKVVGHSLHSTFQPTTFPPMLESVYDKREYPIVEFVYRTQNDPGVKKGVKLHFDFRPLSDEEHLTNFDGADAFLEDNFTPYRFRYDNLNPKQVAPSWSYRGRHPSNEWHTLLLDKFLLPISRDSIHKDDMAMELISEMAQSYPGLGEMMGEAKSIFLRYTTDPTRTPDDQQLFADIARLLAIPLDYNWNKDRGYTASTRFLVPLLDKRDVEYYRDKGTDKDKNNKARETPSDAAQILQTIYAVLDATRDQKFSASIYESRNFTFKPQKHSFYKSFLGFIEHFYSIDISNWNIMKDKFGNFSVVNATGLPLRKPYLLSMDVDAVRKVLVWYMDVVMPQLECVRIMVVESGDRRLSSKELNAFIDTGMQEYIPPHPRSGYSACKLARSRNESIWASGNHFLVPIDKLEPLYNSYHDRKEARQRYSIPVIPKEFPVCRSGYPSPVDIRTTQSRETTIKDYSFGRGAYRLNRFFMFLPLDGSPLLTVGIVDGQRLDESSVQLSGGAVKGQNLTFQYMHMKFSSKWNKIGSEHRIDGVGAPMELQMVFTIAGSADSLKYWHVLARVINQLFQFRDKLVIVISVLVDVLESDEAVMKKIEVEKLSQDPYLFEPLAQAAYHFHSMQERFKGFEDPRGYVSRDPVFRFIDFIPRKSSHFYTYRSSLSWPPCFPYVIWSVFKQRLYMSKRQFDQFALIPSYGMSDTTYLSNNFRRFDDIYVEAEHERGVSYDKRLEMVRLRTVDREILVGFHDLEDEGNFDSGKGIVGEEIYYVNWKDDATTYRVQSKHFYVYGSIVLLVKWLFHFLFFE